MTSTSPTTNPPVRPGPGRNGGRRGLVTLPARTTGLIVLGVLGYLTVAGPGAVVLEVLARNLVPAELVPIIAQLLGEGLLAILLCRTVAARGWWQLAGLLPIPSLRGLATRQRGLAVVLLILLAALAGAVARIATGELSAAGRAAMARTSTGTVVMVVIATMLLVGVNEEVLFRGLALGGLMRDQATSRREVYQAVLAVSLLFGLAHLVHQAPFPARLGLVATTAVWGVVYAGLRLYSGTIWLGLLVHGLLGAGQKLCTLTCDGAYSPHVGALNWSQAPGMAVLILIGVMLIERYLRDPDRRHDALPDAR